MAAASGKAVWKLLFKHQLPGQRCSLRTTMPSRIPDPRNPAGPGPELPLVMSVTSGKGGVGKTNLSVNLAYCLSKMGRKVVLLDADLGLANVDIMLGLTPKETSSTCSMKVWSCARSCLKHRSGFHPAGFVGHKRHAGLIHGPKARPAGGHGLP